MSGILFIHGTGTRQTAAAVAKERNSFVHGTRAGLLQIGKLGLDDLGELAGNDTGLGLDVRFGEYHTMGPVAEGKAISPGDKRSSGVRSLRWVCSCCLQREGTPVTTKLVPTAGAKAQEAVIAKYYPQLHRFLQDSGYRDAVLDAVDDRWPDRTDVVIAHSMGTMVALSALARAPESKQPTLFVTHSPLPFHAVYRRLESNELQWAQEHRPLWLNVHSKNDIATNRRSLPQDRFPDVINLRVRNRNKDPHSAADYLGHQAVAHVLWAVAMVSQPATAGADACPGPTCGRRN